MNIYPENTTAHYVTKLPKHIELVGDWSVSLKEISTPISIVNIKKDTHTFQIKNIKTGKVLQQHSIPSNAYPTESSFIRQLNTMILRSFSTTFRYATVSSTNLRKVKISNSCDSFAFRRNKNLSYLLGFGRTERDYRRGDHVAEGYMNMLPVGNIRNMFVYCDVVEHVIVGDVTAPLLRIVHISLVDPRSAIMYTEVNTPLFVPVQKNSFNTIAIGIMTDTGEPIPFRDDSRKVTLFSSSKNPGHWTD